MASQTSLACRRVRCPRRPPATEFFVEGKARLYKALGTWRSDGMRAAVPTGSPAAYATRLLVRTPKDPAQFNGPVMVEWLNSTFGFDVGVNWAN